MWKSNSFRWRKREEFLISIKKHHVNYGVIWIDIENEKTYSLEIVFYFKDLKDSFEEIIVKDRKIVSKENFQKTKRYNLININKNISIQIFNDYSDNKIENSDKIDLNYIFSSSNLFYNFIYGNNKKLGKIFLNTQEKETEDFDENKITLLKRIWFLSKYRIQNQF